MGILSARASFAVPLSIEQTRARLRAKVKAGALLALEGDDPAQPFRGEVQDASFRIVRRRISRNSFEPVLSGQLLEGEPGATSVSVALEPHLVMIAVVVVWTVLAAACVALLAVTLELPLPVLLGLLAAPLFGPAVAVVAFRLAIPSALQSLQAVLAP